MDTHNSRGSSPVSRYWGAVLLFLAAAGFLVWTEHRAHLYGAPSVPDSPVVPDHSFVCPSASQPLRRQP